MKRQLWIVLIVFVILFGLATPAYADDGRNGRIIFGDNVVVKADEVIEGDLVAFGGNVTLEEKSRVLGDLVAFGGNVSIAGEVTGDAVAIGGNVVLKSTAFIGKDLAVIGGRIDRAEGATVRGDTITSNMWRGTTPWVGPIPFRPGTPLGRFDPFAFTFNVIKALMTMLVFAVLAMLLAALFPAPTDRVKETIRQAPAFSFGIGLLSLIVAILLTVPLGIITLCFGAFVMWAGIVAAVIFGLAGCGLWVGEQVYKNNPSVSVPVKTLVGTLIVTAVPLLTGTLPWIGWVEGFIWAFINCTALGAVVYSRFGTRLQGMNGTLPPYPLVPTPPVPPAPPSPPAPPVIIADATPPAPAETQPPAETPPTA